MLSRLNVALWIVLLYLAAAALARVPQDRPSASHPRRSDPDERPAVSLAADDIGQSLTHNSPRPSEVFKANREKNFVWFDPIKQQELFGIAAALPPRQEPLLSKRVRGPPNIPPIQGNGDCLGCTTKGIAWTIDDFSIDFFIIQALWKKGQKPKQCLFYSPAYDGANDPPGQGDVSRWLAAGGGRTRNDLSPDGKQTRLSSVATKYACKTGMTTIWMTWAGASDDYVGSTTNPKKLNFWEVSKPGSWLWFLSANNPNQRNADQQFQYFTHMSMAFARICTGDIYIMSISPDKLEERYKLPGPSGYPSILWSYELAVLKQRKGISDAVGDLYTINAITEEIKPLDWAVLVNVKPPPTTKRDLRVDGPQGLSSVSPAWRAAPVLAARDTCLANLAYEDGDWFG